MTGIGRRASGGRIERRTISSCSNLLKVDRALVARAANPKSVVVLSFPFRYIWLSLALLIFVSESQTIADCTEFKQFRDVALRIESVFAKSARTVLGHPREISDIVAIAENFDRL